MGHPRLDALRRELHYNHWQHAYNWNQITEQVIIALAVEHNCSKKDVQRIMGEIARDNPNPNKTKNEKLAEKMPNSGKCRSCGAPIVWIDKHPCNPAIQKFVQADGTIATGRISHFSTCPDADKWRKS